VNLRPAGVRLIQAEHKIPARRVLRDEEQVCLIRSSIRCIHFFVYSVWLCPGF
jgi:hypothetical protein